MQNILVVGAGVAGLAAISTASSMGAIVRSFDTRLECREQVESVGGEFLVLDFDDEDGGDIGGTGYSRVMSDTFYQEEMKMFREQANECKPNRNCDGRNHTYVSSFLVIICTSQPYLLYPPFQVTSSSLLRLFLAVQLQSS